MTYVTYGSAFTSLLLTGAIFGFFYAWVCSTMWGLDTLDPRVAIEAMQGMNASVVNAVFAPSFFATPFVCFLTAALCFSSGARSAGLVFAAAGIVYLLGGMILTIAANVPMNEALAEVQVPDDMEAAREIWAAYSPRWQAFNIARTVASGGALLLSGLGLVLLARAG
jgi:uncharacterized membrane protein